MNAAQTEYEVVRKVGRKVCNFRLRDFAEDENGAIKGGQGG